MEGELTMENVTPQKYDIFISYERSTSTIVTDLYYKMLYNKWTVFIERYQASYIEESKKDILKSNIFLVFFTRQYRDSQNCVDKLKFALKKEKKIVYILLHNVLHESLSKPIQVSIKTSPKCLAFVEAHCLKKWSDVLYHDLCEQIEVILNPPINIKQSDTDADLFKCSKYDVFCSFHIEDVDRVKEIHESLENFQLNCWFDTKRVYATANLHADVQRSILDAEIFLCFVTQTYFNSYYAQLEIKFAKRNNKKCIYVMLENLSFSSSGFITLLIANSVRFNAYDEKTYSDSLAKKLYITIYSMYCNLNSIVDPRTKLDYSPEIVNCYRISREISVETKVLYDKSNEIRRLYTSISISDKQRASFNEILLQLDGQAKIALKQKNYIYEFIEILSATEKENMVLIQTLMTQMTQTNKHPIGESGNIVIEATSREETEKSLKKALHKRRALIEQLKFLHKEILFLIELETQMSMEAFTFIKILKLNNYANTREYDLKIKHLFDERMMHFDEYKKLLSSEETVLQMTHRMNIFEKYGVLLRESEKYNDVDTQEDKRADGDDGDNDDDENYRVSSSTTSAVM